MDHQFLPFTKALSCNVVRNKESTTKQKKLKSLLIGLVGIMVIGQKVFVEGTELNERKRIEAGKRVPKKCKKGLVLLECC